MKQAQIFLFFGLLLTACVGAPPLRTYTIARTALESAKKVEATRGSPEIMHKAEESYRQGEFYYKNKDYSSAASFFEESIRYAEDAENRTRLSSRHD